ncbi:MAG: NFACT family protein [Nitrospira sp.]|nr:NFACT family protein [Nitrospira sp.]
MLNVSDLEQVLHEISPALHGGWIQKIHQPGARTLVFDVRVPGHTHRLLISCEANATRLHVTTRPPLNPPAPPPFCQFLRAHVQGARIDDIGQIQKDRIVELSLTGKEGAGTIVCELTGRSANLLVLNAERRIVRDLSQQKALVGQLYTYPTTRTGPQEEALTRFTGTTSTQFPISAAIDAFYQDRASAQAIIQAKETRIRFLKKAIKKELRLIDAWQRDLSKATAYRGYSRYGELLKANLSQIKKGDDHIEVTDYFDELLPQISIPLDSTKSAQGNMDDYFRKHRKYLAAERELTPRIQRADESVNRLRDELKDVEREGWQPSDRPAPQSGRFRITRASADLRPSAGKRQGPFRRFTSTDGLPIFVGRNARENDELTFGLAKTDDLWLHARGVPGSHVVVRLDKGTDPPFETLRDAAMLALLYSDLKKSGKGEVIYTRRKWVKKAKGQAPGAVIVTQEKTVHLTLDRVRLEALKYRHNQE